MLDALDQRGIDFQVLAAEAGQPDADPFDLLCHVAYNAPLLTRKQRAEKLRKAKPDFFDQYGPDARAVLNAILDKYAEHGVGEFAMPNVLEVPPISDPGQSDRDRGAVRRNRQAARCGREVARVPLCSLIEPGRYV